VGNKNVLFYHEQAFLNTQAGFDEIQRKFAAKSDKPFHFVKVANSQVSVDEAVKSYLFNTQLVDIGNDQMAIIAPMECKESESVHNYLNELVTLDSPIKQVHYFDVKQSMRNGGGPACLRLRVALNEQELAATNQNVLMSDELFARLNTWVDTHYRDVLSEDDLRDPNLVVESRTALDELTKILNLGSVYPFQL
jgi:succinylarginine dihydrolase